MDVVLGTERPLDWVRSGCEASVGIRCLLSPRFSPPVRPEQLQFDLDALLDEAAMADRADTEESGGPPAKA
ncbi:hypothetical protein GCM10009798_08090 [Nocardioides panacihumi]|uniref:Uncharacterized protein n=1 Tax=Nocardioides panacihumi TaxID=400774 RepID=A0ABP5BUY3_9ACTN